MSKLLIGGLVVLGAASASAQATPARMSLFPPAELEWKDGPASLPKGAKMVILEGDPAQPGVSTTRIRCTDRDPGPSPM